MHPILFSWGPITLRTYGAMMALAFLGALELARLGARARHLPEPPLLDLSAVLVVFGLLGGRVLYVLLNWSWFAHNPLDAFKVWEGGLVFYGGFLVASAAGLWFIRRSHLPLGDVADVMAPALAVGQAIGRWGCFFAGCCYGKPTTLPWGVRFTHPASLAPLDIPLHPVQLYESFGNLMIAFVLWLELHRHPQSRGRIFWLYVLLYAVLRLIMESLRGDDRGPTIGGLYPSQIIAILAIIVAGSIIAAMSGSGRHRPAEIVHGS